MNWYWYWKCYKAISKTTLACSTKNEATKGVFRLALWKSFFQEFSPPRNVLNSLFKRNSSLYLHLLDAIRAKTSCAQVNVVIMN